MKVTLKDGSFLEFEAPITAKEVALAISEGLARNAVCAKVNGELVDLSHVLKEGDSLEIVTFSCQQSHFS